MGRRSFFAAAAAFGSTAGALVARTIKRMQASAICTPSLSLIWRISRDIINNK